jgi:hypothetical protein
MQLYKPKVKTGHVVPGMPLDRVKERLSLVRGSLVEAPIVRYFHPLHLQFLVLTFRITRISSLTRKISWRGPIGSGSTLRFRSISERE